MFELGFGLGLTQILTVTLKFDPLGTFNQWGQIYLMNLLCSYFLLWSQWRSWSSLLFRRHTRHCQPPFWISHEYIIMLWSRGRFYAKRSTAWSACEQRGEAALTTPRSPEAQLSHPPASTLFCPTAPCSDGFKSYVGIHLKTVGWMWIDTVFLYI